MRTLAPGLVVGGKYRLLRALGEGGMSAVFEVEHILTHRRAALKWLHPELGAHEGGQSRLLQEARATSRVRHRHVVDLYDVVEEDGALYLVMELLAGELLSQWLVGGERTLGQLLALLLPAMEGIAAAHAVGVVHRDIKPANIFLAQSGEPQPVPKVIDFGISRSFGDERLTCSGMAMGTPRYVSFEQLRGERDVDARSDVYAIGVMLYEALVGRAPHEAKTFAEQAIRFATMQPPLLRVLRPELPVELEALVMRAVARERDARHPSMQALIEALAPFASHPCASLRLWRARAVPDAAPTVRSPRESGSRSSRAAEAARLRIRTSQRRWAMAGALVGFVLVAQGVRAVGTTHAPHAAAQRTTDPRAVPRAAPERAEIVSTPTNPARAGEAERAQELAPEAVAKEAPVRTSERVQRAAADAHALRPRPRQRPRAALSPSDVAAARPPLDVATPSSSALRAGQLLRREF